MSANDSINRRQFLEKSSLLAAAATAVGGARTASAQINNSAAVSTKPVRLGFIGVGIRGTLLMEAAAGIAGVEIKAVADCYKGHLDRAQELITPAPAVTGDYKEILSRADIDAVVIATPDHWHLKMTQEALAAGKHVYVEKPMTHSWEEGEAFISAVEKSGKVLQVGSQYMSMGCAQKAVELIKSGRLGQITLVEGKFHRNTATGAWYYPIPPDASPATVDFKSFLGAAPPHDFDLRRFFQWRLFWDYSGGLPTDLFVHLVTATHQLMGVQEPESVFSFGDIYHWKNYREVPDQMTSMVKYPEGFVLRLSSTASNGHPGPLLTVLRERGDARVHRRLLQVLLRAAHGGLRLLDPLLAQGHHGEVQAAHEPERRPEPARRARGGGAGRVQVAERRGLDPRARPELGRGHPHRRQADRGRALRPPRRARRPHVQPVLQGRQAGPLEQDDPQGRGLRPARRWPVDP